MKNVKRLAALALSMVVTTSLFAGCGAKKETATSSNGTGKKDEIVLWTYPQYKADPAVGTPGYEDLLKDLIAQYKKDHPNVEVKYEILSWDEGEKKFDIALNAGTPPDIFYTTAQSKYVKTGLALPVDEYITDKDKADFVPFALDRYKIDGKQYGLPTWISTHCLAGERTFFKEAGIDYKKIMEKGWTWEEFEQDIKKIAEQQKAKSGKNVYGFVTEGKTDEMFRHFMMSNGLGTGLSKDGKFQFTGNGVVETLDFFKKLMDEGLLPKETAGIDTQKAGDIFNDGQAAVMGRVGPYQIRFNNNRNAGIDAGKVQGSKRDIMLLPFPYGKGGKNVVYGDCGGYMAFRQKQDKGKEHAKNVADLMKLVTSTDASIASASVFTTPARKSGQEAIKGKIKADDENLAFMNNAVNIIQSRPILNPDIDAKYSKVSKEAMIPLFQAFLAGEKKSADVEKGITTKANDAFGK